MANWYCSDCGDTKALVGVPCTECGAMPSAALTFPVAPSEDVEDVVTERVDQAMLSAATRVGSSLWNHWTEDLLILMIDLKWAPMPALHLAYQLP